MSKYNGFILGICLVTLIAAKPWGTINRVIGIAPSRTHADSVSLSTLTQQDSLFVQQAAAIIVAPGAADTVATAISEAKEQTEQKQKQLDYLREQKDLLGDDVERMKSEVKAMQARRVKASQSLLHEKEIEELLARQKGKPKSDKAGADSESDLERTLNAKHPN